MKDFKIEYIDGQLVALDIDGQSQLDKTAVQAISFTHEQGASPVLRITVAEQIVAPAQPETGQPEEEGELLFAENAPRHQRNRNKNRNRNRSH